MAKALKAARIEARPVASPSKKAQKGRARKALFKVDYKSDCGGTQCKLIISDLKTNHKLVYDRLYQKFRTRYNEVSKALEKMTEQRDYYKSVSPFAQTL